MKIRESGELEKKINKNKTLFRQKLLPAVALPVYDDIQYLCIRVNKSRCPVPSCIF